MKLSASSLIIRNKKSGQLMHALKKTKVIEASLTNLHNSQNAMLWRFGIKTLTLAIFRWSFYLILHFSFSLSCFNNMTGKVWRKKTRWERKRL